MSDERNLSIREALNEALAEEMERDKDIFLMGEEVGHYDGAYKVSRGLLERFGERRVIDTPIAENGFAGVGIGAAMVGLRPVIEFMTWNFALIAIDQIVNSAAKMRYMSGGQVKVPVTFRGPSGAVMQLAAQHSQSFESYYGHIPGLIVVTPCNAQDAKGLLKSAIRDDNPVVFMESEAMYGIRSHVKEGEFTIPLGQCDTKRGGEDVTLVCWGKTVQPCLDVADMLSEKGISAEVIDIMTVRPLDEQTLIQSLKKTNRMVVVQEAWPQASVGSWIAHRMQEEAFDFLDAPIRVLSGRDCPYPYATSIEKVMAPSKEQIVETVHRCF